MASGEYIVFGTVLVFPSHDVHTDLYHVITTSPQILIYKLVRFLGHEPI